MQSLTSTPALEGRPPSHVVGTALWAAVLVVDQLPVEVVSDLVLVNLVEVMDVLAVHVVLDLVKLLDVVLVEDQVQVRLLIIAGSIWNSEVLMHLPASNIARKVHIGLALHASRSWM